MKENKGVFEVGAFGVGFDCFFLMLSLEKIKRWDDHKIIADSSCSDHFRGNSIWDKLIRRRFYIKKVRYSGGLSIVAFSRLHILFLLKMKKSASELVQR